MKALRPRREARGFTLIELLVAMTAGLMVSAAAFLLARNATRVFQQESRISGAQLAATLGMNRLAADLQRAAFLGTPNFQRDPARCGSYASPPALLGLSGVRLLQAGSVGALPEAAKSQLDKNGMAPDALVISGSFSTTEQFPVRMIGPSVTGGLEVHLQTNSGAVARTIASATSATGATLQATFDGIFKPGYFLRLVDAVGRHEYGLIHSVEVQESAGAPTDIVVHLSATPTVPQKTPSTTCGLTGLGVGILANPVSQVRYDIRSLQGDEAYGKLVAAKSPALTGDDGRTELVRVELDQDGNERAETRELVAEYAVDLRFGLTMATAGAAPVLSRLPIPMTPEQYALASDATNPAAIPERIRAVQVRLAVRARAADRDVDLPPGPDGRRYRFLIPGIPAPNYARLRTLYADVALPNQAGVNW